MGPFETSDAVFRLRAMLLGIALLLLGASAIAARELQVLARVQGALQTSLSSLVSAHELETRLSASLRQLDQVRTVGSVAELDALGQRLRIAVTGDDDLAARPMADAASLGVDLARVERAALEGLPVRRTMLSIDRTLAARRLQLDVLSERFLARLEPRLSDLAVALDARLVEGDGDGYVGVGTGVGTGAGTDVRASGGGDVTVSDRTTERPSLSELIDRRTRLTELLFRTSALIDTARELSFGTTDGENPPDAAPMAYAFTGMATILVTLEDGPLRKSLASIARELRDAVLGPSGIIAMLERHADETERLAAAGIEQGASILRLSSRTESVVRATRESAAEAARRADEARSRTAIVLSVTAALALALIASIAFVVAERQIARRLSRLSATVLAVARGDTDATVGVSGDDEIGRMASAVEVFKRNAAQLTRSNLELEEFAYAASHDMRSPLRAIENLAQWTLEDNGDRLDDEGRENLQRILDRTGRLDALLRDLLDYARAGHAEPAPERVNPRELVAELSDLLVLDERFEVRYEGSPAPLLTPVTPLRQVLMNLIGNALKHHDRDTGTILVRIDRRGMRADVTVVDDGPGIGPEYQQQVFKLFETLRSRDDVEGSGLGLALVKKLVTRFGGTVRVESDPSVRRGATIVFDWPIG